MRNPKGSSCGSNSPSKPVLNIAMIVFCHLVQFDFAVAALTSFAELAEHKSYRYADIDLKPGCSLKEHGFFLGKLKLFGQDKGETATQLYQGH